MNKDQALGIARELATAIGAALVTFGVTTSSTVELILGLLLAALSLVFAYKANEGKDIVLSLFRKVLSSAAGILSAYGLLTPEKAEAISAVVLVVVSASWSFQSNGDGSSGSGASISPLWILALLALSLPLTSCTGIMAGVTGQPILTEPVKTTDGREIKVASADVLRTKLYPTDTAWGLYNAGLVAQRASEVIDAGK